MSIGGFVKDLFDGGASRNHEKNADLHDAQEDAIKAMHEVADHSGAEMDSTLEEDLAQLEKDHNKRESDITKMGVVNTALNVGGAALSVVNVGGLAGKAASKLGNKADDVLKVAASGADEAAGVAGKGAQIAAESTGNVINAADMFGKNAGKATVIVEETAKNAGTAVQEASKVQSYVYKAGQHALNAVDTIGNKLPTKVGELTNKVFNYARNPQLYGLMAEKGATGRGVVGNIVTLGLKGSPLVASEIYTHKRSGALGDRLDNQLRAISASCSYLESSDADLTYDKGESLKSWRDDYDSNCESLLNQLNSGKLTQAEYDKKYEELTESSYADLDTVLEGYKERGTYIIGEGNTAAMAEASMGLTQKEFDELGYHNSYIQTSKDEHSEAWTDVQRVAGMQYGNCNSAFASFFATINAKIVEVCPFVATLEATALKAVDSTYDFVRDTVKGGDTVSKYQDKSISEIAQGIREFSDEHLEKKNEFDSVRKDMKERSSAEYTTAQTGEVDDHKQMALAMNTDTAPEASPV